MTAQRPEVSESDESPSNVHSVPAPGSNTSVPPASHTSEAPRAASSLPPASQGVQGSERPVSQAPLDEAAIAALREQLAKQESQNRVHEVVKTLVALGDAVPDREERVLFYARAADLYANKFMNQAEAVKANEKIFSLQPTHDAAREYLRQMYEKRRDWEKLVRLRQSEASRLPSERDRSNRMSRLRPRARWRASGTSEIPSIRRRPGARARAVIVGARSMFATSWRRLAPLGNPGPRTISGTRMDSS